jgi:hypothetical protein
MRRAAVTVAVCGVLAAWAGAQGPGPLPADDQIRLFRANRVLLGSLIERGVELGATDDPGVRAEACQKAAHDLAVAFERAAEADDPHRAAELGDHLEAVVRDGLLPNLDAARQLYPPESQHAKKLAEYKQAATRDLAAMWAEADRRPKVSTDAQVKALRDRLDALKDRLK